MNENYTLWLFELHNSVIIIEEIHFADIGQRLGTVLFYDTFKFGIRINCGFVGDLYWMIFSNNTL
jgi:hypothetical protein